MRMPTRAHADSQMMLRASLRVLRLDGVDRERRLAPVRLPRVWSPAEKLHPGNSPACSRNCASSRGERVDALSSRARSSGRTFS